MRTPHVLPFLVILQCCRREGQKAVVGVNIWTRRVKIRKMTRRRQLWKGNSSVPRERTLWENKGTERTFWKFSFAIPAPPSGDTWFGGVGGSSSLGIWAKVQVAVYDLSWAGIWYLGIKSHAFYEITQVIFEKNHSGSNLSSLWLVFLARKHPKHFLSSDVAEHAEESGVSQLVYQAKKVKTTEVF